MKIENTIRNSVKTLQTIRCPDEVWQRIEEQLENINNTHSKTIALPLYTCPDNVWDTILISLERKSTIKLWKAYAVAASITLIITCSIILLTKHNDSSLSFYEEDFGDQTAVLQSDNNNDDVEFKALAFISSECNTNMQPCHSKEYKTYMDEFMKLRKELDELNNLLKDNQDKTELIEAKVQLENNKADLLKNMVKLFLR